MPRPAFTRVLALVLLLAAAAASADERPLPVTVRAAAEVLVARSQSAPATAVALQRTRVAARVGAPVERFEVEVGDRVERGQVLAELECLDAVSGREAAAAALEEARARARLADLRLERIQRLRAQDAVSAEELDLASAERRALAASVTRLQSELARARRDVERCSVRAPVAGRVTARHAHVGDLMAIGTPLLTLVAETDLEVRVDVTATDAPALLAAPEVSFRAADESYPLERPRRTGVVDPATGIEEVRLRFAGDGRPRPGRAGRVHWRSAATAVPADLLVRRAGRLGVFLAVGDRAAFHEIAGAVEGRPAPVDLPPASRLIIEGRHAASDGMRLQIIE